MQKALPAQDIGLTARERLFMASLFADSATIIKKPERIAFSAWTGHIPFAFWVTKAANPDTLVELGSHFGVSFGAFCQQAVLNGRDCLCYAVDTWHGDEHAGFYGEEVFADIFSYMREKYYGHAHLVRCAFDEALPLFDDGSIDLLHIDGYHTREAILHDFETWLPKMSERGVVLLHDINARIPGYNGFDAWREIAARFPHFNFDHCFGLGIVLAGGNPPEQLRELTMLGAEAKKLVQNHFARAGELCTALFMAEATRKDAEKAHQKAFAAREEAMRAQVGELNERHAREIEELNKNHQKEIAAFRENVERDRNNLLETIKELQEQIHGFANSKSWKLTEPLRMARRIFK